MLSLHFRCKVTANFSYGQQYQSLKPFCLIYFNALMVVCSFSRKCAEIEKLNKIITVYVILAFRRYQIKEFCVILHLHSEKSAKTYCSIDSQSPPRMSKHVILGLPHKAQLSHIYMWLVVSRESYGESLRLLYEY